MGMQQLSNIPTMQKSLFTSHVTALVQGAPKMRLLRQGDVNEGHGKTIVLFLFLCVAVVKYVGLL
jgi:RecG-like helicase